MGSSHNTEHRVHDTDHADTAVLSDLFESLESADDLPTFGGPSDSAFIARPEFELEELMPEGPYTLRILGHVYDQVDRTLLMQLLRRGLLVGSEVWLAPQWVAFAQHPDFGAIQAQMAEELERVVDRRRPRELTPQPHWQTPEELRRTDEVTRPHVHRDEIFGAHCESENLEEMTGPGQQQTSDAYDDTRETTELDAGPFREFAAQLDTATERLEPDAIERLQLDDGPNPFAEPISTDVSQPMALTDVAEEELIDTREGSSPLLATELPTRERGASERVRRASPLEGSRSAATQFPTAVSTSDSAEPLPGAAILKPQRRKRPTASIPRPLPMEEPGTTPPRERRAIPGWLVLVAAAAIVISIIAIAVLAARTLSAESQPARATPEPIQKAVGASAMRIHDALPRAFADGRDVAAVAAGLADEPGAHRTYVLESLHAARPTHTSALEAARANLDTGELQAARRLAVEALMLGASADDAREVFAATLTRDESFRLPHSESIAPERVESARLGQTSVLVQLKGEEPARFYPALQREPDAFRPALAMVALCNVLDCPFEIAPTRRVLLERTSLERALVEQPDDDELRLDDLRWSTSEHGEVVEGALILTPKNARPFPIADHETWRPWLNAGELTSDQLQQMRESFGAPDATPRRLENTYRPQLSALLTIDFLVNNWGRLPTDVSVTTMWRDESLISARHDAAFATRSSKRASGRFDWVQVFDRELIARIRLLSPDAVDPILFDADDPVSRARRAEFWNQREELLEAVEDAEKRQPDAIWL